MAIFEYKREGGKLIGVSFNYTQDTFSDVVIYGDFFVFPEEEVDNLEKLIEGRNLSQVLDLIEDFFLSSVEVYGITKEDVKEVFKRAINEK
ncbi:MAG: Lipoate-protein ligase A subunit 2 [Candidatus Methanofastidiosum methylothiophilum]|uniref:Lipoate-protein ligase A subunit 2 n=1 Tax=Candidatus Methanofastidiosum methylothiophilum TaxID=1705564 RepID=A0A150IPA1_9EURY|nr:MAG: Lipoate-protein ligase A subunit 2 [Candidatus Methanofastidiosum methylthiophilus]KYC46881.1 MAG: Lipoate-protein ligase A subunit 2 [Candidatus Methanofastidiosum methylthiophilus]KYC49310.1 MAG: Lipoate-protein ligase A subunit 2 [Candidatus Methanofastidiosum methylthiophilus]